MIETEKIEMEKMKIRKIEIEKSRRRAASPAACGLIFGCAVLWFSLACGGGSSPSSNNNSSTQTTPPTGSNVASITVNSGPQQNYANGAFISLTVCAPGTSTCQTVGGILVDTGSTGLRILSSALTVALPQQKASSGNAVVECFPFVSGYTWGPVETADVQIAGEKASSLPLQVIGSEQAVPTSCSSFGTNSGSNLGANGILGVGLAPQDCGTQCQQTGSANPALYYECPAAGCTVAQENPAQQVQNPVSLFASDNNGVIIELPAVSGSETSITGSLVFGIGTQSNNGLGRASVYTTDDYGNFTTTYKNQSYSGSFIDSGSNGYFFLDSSTTGIPACPSQASGFYCPSTTESLSATNTGNNGTSGAVNFSVANADSLFNSTDDFVFGDLGGEGIISGQSEFDWGLPFFYGRNVYTAIAGQNTPGGPGPYWAY